MGAFIDENGNYVYTDESGKVTMYNPGTEGGAVTTPGTPNPASLGAPPESSPGPGSAVGGKSGVHEIDSSGAPIANAGDIFPKAGPTNSDNNVPGQSDLANNPLAPVVIAGGDVIDRSEWDKLDPAVQKIMKTKGYDAAIQYINAQNYQADVQARADKVKWESDKIKVGYDQWTGDWSGDYISKADYDKLSPEDQQIVNSRGFGALDSKLQADEARQTAALDKLKDYRVTDARNPGGNYQNSSYDINAYLLQAKSPGEALQTLKDAGFDKDQIAQAAKENNDAANQSRADVEKNYSPMAIAKTTGNMVADMVIPGLSTAKNWGGLTTWQKVVYPLLDVATIIPIIGTGAKLVGVGVKGVSEGAKIASLGGREALDVAAKDAATQLEGATTKIAGQRALYEDALQKAKSAATPQLKKIYQNAADLQNQDLALMDKQLGKLQENVKTLNDLSAKAANSSNSIGAKIYQGAEKVESVPEKIKVGLQKGPIKASTTAAQIVNKGGAAAISGVAAYSTIHDWNNLSPAQRLAGLAMAAIPIGGFGAARNVAENVVNPFKIPLKGIGARVTRGGKPEPGIIWAEEGGKTGGTTRLVLDPKVPPEQARNAVASLMRQLHDTGGVGKVEYAGHEITMKGTDFQKAVGGNVSFHATPMGELFKKGSGSAGAKTRMELYLEKVNKNLTPDKQIKIEGTYKVKDANSGQMIDTPIAAVTTPGVTVVGKEGGLYVGQMLYNKFSHMSAYGAKGQVEAGVLLHDAGIDKLPPQLARQKLGVMEEKAYKLFNGSTDVNKIVEGFKEYKIYQEAENVITNGSQVQRVQNLRSKLGDMLKESRGEYFTRDSKGRIELFQMYIQGGRTTPYTLKELYALKGNALKNALADLAQGLKYKYDELRGKTPSVVEEVLPTKEEKIAATFAKIDQDVKEGNMTKAEAAAAKREAIAEVRDTSEPTLRREAAEQARDRALEGIRRPPHLEENVARAEAARASERPSARAAAARPGNRADAGRPAATRSSRTAPTRSASGAPEPSRANPPRPEGSRATPPRPNNTTRANATRTTPDRVNPPRPDTPRPKPPRPEPPRPPRPDRITRNSEGKVTLPDNTFSDLLTPEEAAASVAWPEMGDRWYVIKPPYTQQDVLAFKNNALPAGIKNIFRGKKEAYRGIQTFAGVGKGVPPNLKVDVGFEDAFIEKPASAGKPGTIGFRPDPHLETTNPLTTKGVKVIGAKAHDNGLTSTKRHKQFFTKTKGGNQLISRRPLGKVK